MFRSIVGSAAIAVVWASVAAAAPATPEEAQRLTTVLEQYVGHADGHPTVTVTPHGEAYTATFDLTRMLAVLSPLGLDVTAGELVAELQPQADGQWHVVVNGLPPVGMSVGGQATAITWNGYTFDALFDPQIQTFSTATTTSGGSTAHSVGKQGTSDTQVVDKGVSTAKAVAASAAGLVNVDATSSIKDVDYRLSVVPSGTEPASQAIRVGLSDIDSTVALTDQPTAAITDLWRFLVVHPSKAALVADQAELKTKLKAVIPLASSAKGDFALSKIKVETSLGAFGLDSLSEHYTFGIGPDAVATTVKMAGLALPDGLLPAWSASLLPSTLDLSQAYGPVSLTPALHLLIDDLDLAADTPLTATQQADVLQAMAGEVGTIHVAPSSITTPTLSLKFQGEGRTTKPMPSGSATVSATGLDKTIAAIRTAAGDDPMAQQAIVLLMAAKGVGQAEGPDSYSWKIEAPAGGELTVNGNALSALSAQPGAAAPRPKAHKPKPAP